MPYKPLLDRVALKRIEKSEEISSPFITPDTAKEKATECEVVGVSDGYKTDFGAYLPSPVSIGDRVLIGKYAGNEHKVTIDGKTEEWLFVRWSELLAVEPKKEPAPKSKIPANITTYTGGLPSKLDLDAIADEQEIAEQTKGTEK